MFRHIHNLIHELEVELAKYKQLCVVEEPPALYGAKPRHKDWAKFQKQILQRDGNKCQFCEGEDFLQVHHLEPYHIKPNLELIESNCITLCMGKFKCHFTCGHLALNWNVFNPNCLDWITLVKKVKLSHQKCV